MYGSIIYNSQVLEIIAQVPMSNWIKKLWYIYTMEYYAAEKKKLPPFMTAWMELEIIMLSKISQALNDKYHMISPISRTQSTKKVQASKI